MNDYEKIVVKRLLWWALKWSWLWLGVIALWYSTAHSFYYHPAHEQNMSLLFGANFFGLLVSVIFVMVSLALWKGATEAIKASKKKWKEAVEEVKEEYESRLEEL